jgi:hypothetical protein
MYQPKVGSYAVYEPPEEGWENWEAQSAQINSALAKAGVQIIPAQEAVKDLASCQRVMNFFASQNVDMLHALIVSWSFDHYTVEIQQKVEKPVLIRAIPGIRTGSVVGSMQLNCVLSDIEVPHRMLYGEIEDENTIADSVTYAKACAIQNKLRGSKQAARCPHGSHRTPHRGDDSDRGG